MHYETEILILILKNVFPTIVRVARFLKRNETIYLILVASNDERRWSVFAIRTRIKDYKFKWEGKVFCATNPTIGRLSPPWNVTCEFETYGAPELLFRKRVLLRSCVYNDSNLLSAFWNVVTFFWFINTMNDLWLINFIEQQIISRIFNQFFYQLNFNES